MQKLAILALTALIAACSSSPKDPYERRAYEERERREALAERALSQAPKWMTELPTSANAVYANGTSASGDFSMADAKAKMVAYSKICMAAGGRVSQRGRMFLQDTGDSSYETSEQAIQSLCPSVDITGVEIKEIKEIKDIVEIKEIKRINEGGRFRTYVLVALPTGEANQLQQRKDRLRLQQQAGARSEKAFKELEKSE